jgi:hypothetical protein
VHNQGSRGFGRWAGVGGSGLKEMGHTRKRNVRKEKAMGQLGKKVGWFSFEDPTQEAKSLSIFLDYCKIKSNSNGF